MMGVIIFLTACFSLLCGLGRRIQQSVWTARRLPGCTRAAMRYALPAALALILGALPAAPAAANRGTILVYGDSLSAAYGISQKDGWPSLLQERLRKSALD